MAKLYTHFVSIGMLHKSLWSLSCIVTTFYHKTVCDTNVFSNYLNLINSSGISLVNILLWTDWHVFFGFWFLNGMYCKSLSCCWNLLWDFWKQILMISQDFGRETLIAFLTKLLNWMRVRYLWQIVQAENGLPKTYLLKASTLRACYDFLFLWGEFST